jgi:hypothetical protein
MLLSYYKRKFGRIRIVLCKCVIMTICNSIVENLVEFVWCLVSIIMTTCCPFTRYYAKAPKLSTILCELHVVMIALTTSARQILLNCRSYCTCSMITSCRSTGLMFYMIIFTRYYANCIVSRKHDHITHGTRTV